MRCIVLTRVGYSCSRVQKKNNKKNIYIINRHIDGHSNIQTVSQRQTDR